jgi:hypothetical protein
LRKHLNTYLKSPLVSPQLYNLEAIMFKIMLIGVIVATGSVACASTPTPRTQTAAAANSGEVRPDCIKTGSRIAAKPGECSAAPGRSYSQDDILRTGQTDVAHALQQLDPSITR